MSAGRTWNGILALRSNSWRRGDAEARTIMDSDSSGIRSSAPDYPPHRFDQLGRVVADAIFENGLHILDILDFL